MEVDGYKRIVSVFVRGERQMGIRDRAEVAVSQAELSQALINGQEGLKKLKGGRSPKANTPKEPL